MTTSGPTPKNDADINDLLDKERLEGLAKQFNIPGLSASYVNKDGNITTMPVGSEANPAGAVVKDDSIFCAASLSKPLFSYLILRLAADNKINLDDSLDSFLKKPDLESDTPVSEWIKNEELKKLTPRMILQHRTGLPIGGQKGNIEFQFKPGTNYGYSGIGIQCLQEAVKAKTGRDLEDLAKEYVFDHCGMVNSSFKPTPDSPMQTPLVAANSLHTTTEDYAKFILKWMNDDNVEDAFQFEEDFTMQKDPWAVGMKSIEDDEIEIEGIDNSDLDSLAWGMGVGLQKNDDSITAFHTGDATDSRAFVAFNLKDKTAVVFFANSDNGLALVDEISSKTVGLEAGLNYSFQKYGFERNFEDGWEDKQNARMDRIMEEFPPNQPYLKTSKSRKNEDTIAPLLEEARENTPSLTQLSEDKESPKAGISPKAKPKPTDEVEVKIYDPKEKDPSIKWKKVRVKK